MVLPQQLFEQDGLRYKRMLLMHRNICYVTARHMEIVDNECYGSVPESTQHLTYSIILASIIIIIFICSRSKSHWLHASITRSLVWFQYTCTSEAHESMPSFSFMIPEQPMVFAGPRACACAIIKQTGNHVRSYRCLRG